MASTASYSNQTASPSSSFTDASLAQDHFAAQFDLDNPMAAVNSYARIMRDHTQRQMDIANQSARRRSPKITDATSRLPLESSIGSVDSRGN
ncbi:hypothetical protein MMC19_003595 [Ptychographa xylographoides]|nr:hypothetical protein [Ptychographa xylographoides]